jgi:7-keto-8-aminopelargonate synthetase-like enzyme
VDEVATGPDRCRVTKYQEWGLSIQSCDVAIAGNVRPWVGPVRALLVLDEAHVVFGPDMPESEHPNTEVLWVGTLSKALGSLGGFMTGPARFIELLVNRARPFIFTTAPTPADAAAALPALGVLRSEEGVALCSRLSAHVDRVNRTVGRAAGHSPIVPVIIGEEADADAASEALAERGTVGAGHPRADRAPRDCPASCHSVCRPYR